MSLLSLYPTLTELCGLPKKADNHGPSLVPLLTDPKAEWPHVAVTYIHKPGTIGLSAEGWRYIRYADGGGEELYDIGADPYEWTNLAGRAEHASKLAELRALAPTEFAEMVKPTVESLPKLKWVAGVAPPSKPDGNPFAVVFINRRDAAVELFWMDREGKPKTYGSIEPGASRRQQTRPGAVWQVASSDGGEVLGHFVVDDRAARAVIPKK